MYILRRVARMVEGLKIMIKENRLFHPGKRKACCVVSG